METFILSVSNYDRDGRSRSLVNIFRHIGRVSIITKYKLNSVFLRHDVNYCEMGSSGVVRQLKFLFDYIRRSSRSDLVLVDNRKAALFALFLYPVLRRRIIIYDMREFYLYQTSNSIKNNLGTCIESIFLKLADIVISPNKYRARLTKARYGLKFRPLVLENNRQIASSADNGGMLDNFNRREELILVKSKALGRFNFVSTDGFSCMRRSLEIIKACTHFSDRINLYIFGNGKEQADRYIKDNGLKNIYHLGAVDANVLGGFLKYMDVGFVIYGSHDLNNKYCASGKIYEFSHLGIPVITSNNASLREVTRRYGIGVSTEDVSAGIREVIDQLDQFKVKCVEFSTEMNVEQFESISAEKIIDYLGEIGWSV